MKKIQPHASAFSIMYRHSLLNFTEGYAIPPSHRARLCARDY